MKKYKAFLISFSIALGMVGCGKIDEPKEEKQAEPSEAMLWRKLKEDADRIISKTERNIIRITAASQWSDGINPEQMAKALTLCEKHRSSLEKDCQHLVQMAKTIADAAASCQQNTTELCRSLLATPGLDLLGKGEARPLPEHPFYKKIGNEILDAYAPKLGYRSEVFGTWLARWSPAFLGALLLVLLYLGRRLQVRRKEAEAEAAYERECEAHQQMRAQEAERQAAEAAAEAAARAKAQKEAQRAAEQAKREAREAAEQAAEEAEREAAASAARRAEEEAEREAHEKAIDEKLKADLAAAMAGAFQKKPNKKG